MNVATNAVPNLKKVLVVVFTSMISLCAAGELAVPNACMIIYDTTQPTAVLTGSPSVTAEVRTPYVDAGATATDDVDGDITSRIVTVNSVNSSKIGNYAVTYDVADSAGNAAIQVIRSVNVVDTTPPVITVK